MKPGATSPTRVPTSSGTLVGVAVGGTGVGVAVGGTGVAVGGTGVAVGGTGVAVGGTGVAVGGTGVAVDGNGVAACGTGVSVGGTGVAVDGTGVAVGGTGVAVGGTGVAVGAGGASVGTAIAVRSSFASWSRISEVEGRSPTRWPTYFHLSTPSLSTTNVDGVASSSPKRPYTPYSRGTSREGSYRIGNGMFMSWTTFVAPLRSSTLIASTSAFRPCISSYTLVSSPSCPRQDGHQKAR